jgi:hypothetical protein
VRIVKGGTVGSTERSAGAAWPTPVDAFDSFGSSSDLWGETWAASDINSAGFGAALSASGAGGDQAYVDSCRITVHYTVAGVAYKAVVVLQAVKRAGHF